MTREQLLQLANTLPKGADVQFSVNVSCIDSDSEDRVFISEFDEVKHIRDNSYVICGVADSYNF